MDRRGDGSDHVRRGKYALSCFMGQCTLQQVVGPDVYISRNHHKNIWRRGSGMEHRLLSA